MVVKRWLVVFASGSCAPIDATVADVRAETHLGAIREAIRISPPPHPWTIVKARPWPRGIATVDEAVAALGS